MIALLRQRAGSLAALLTVIAILSASGGCAAQPAAAEASVFDVPSGNSAMGMGAMGGLFWILVIFAVGVGLIVALVSQGNDLVPFVVGGVAAAAVMLLMLE